MQNPGWKSPSERFVHFHFRIYHVAKSNCKFSEWNEQVESLCLTANCLTVNPVQRVFFVPPHTRQKWKNNKGTFFTIFAAFGIFSNTLLNFTHTFSLINAYISSIKSNYPSWMRSDNILIVMWKKVLNMKWYFLTILLRKQMKNWYRFRSYLKSMLLNQ